MYVFSFILTQKLRPAHLCEFFPSIWIYIWTLPLPPSGSRSLCFSTSSEQCTSQGCSISWQCCLPLTLITWIHLSSSLAELSNCPFIPSFFASSNLFPGLYQISGTPRFPRNPCYFTEYFRTSGEADLVLLRRRFTILWTIYIRNKMNSKYQNDRYGQGWDWGEVSEAPRMQYLTLNLQNPRSECFLKFCTLGTSLVSP